MGDMKTPDFDDLLAAFDIPDIDAQEAIQSSPEEEEEEEEQQQRGEAGSHRDGRTIRSPPCFPCSPTLDSDRPAVSVIVKNTVRSESFEEEKSITDSPPVGDSAPKVQVNLHLGPKLSSDAAVDCPIANGFEGSASAWSLDSPPRSLSHNDADKGGTSSQHDIMNSLKPLLFPQSLSSAGLSSSMAPPPLTVGHKLSPHSPQREEANVVGHPLSSPLQQNRSIKVGLKEVAQLHSDDDDSEPDLGSPLVIQESPESPMSSPPKLNLRAGALGSPEAASCDISHPPLLSAKPKQVLKDEEEHSTMPLSPTTDAPQPPGPKPGFPPAVTASAPVQDEIYPEHVIDERDSPESPPPSETGLIVPNRSSSPAFGKAPDLDVNHRREEPMETESSREDTPGHTEELSEKTRDTEKMNDETSGAGKLFEDTMSANVTESESSPLRPLKVKIKMVTGSITRTVPGVAAVRNAKAPSKAADGSKPSPEIKKAKTTKPKAAMGAKPRASPTAVSITKTTALPSVAPQRASGGRINLRNLGHKTINSGMVLGTPAPLTSQTGSRPASIVNNTGATISRSQTNLVEAFNKILNNKSLLPCYKPDLSSPPPAEWGIAVPAQGFRCLECGDAFVLEQSLARHYDRRSLRIEVTCNHCAKRLAFFNKCSLLLHAREHKEKGLIMQCSHLVMKTVPLEQMIGQQDPATPAASSANTKSQTHKSAAGKKTDEVQHVGNKCPECQTQFSSKEEVAEHFLEIKPAHTTSCSECSPPMLLPNSCSAAAHQRIHQGSAPHVCPECGGTAQQAHFNTHLHDTCLHFSRRIGYRCSSCQVVFGGLNSVKSHIQQAHCDIFHKCPSCPMAFKSAPSIQNHIAALHPTHTDGQAMLIYKCVMCDTVFTHKPLLYVHFDTHLTNQKVHVFKCPECPKLFSQRNSLMDHYKTHPKTSASAQKPSSPPPPSPPAPSPRSRPAMKLESSDGEDWNDEEREAQVKAERVKTPSWWKCAPCHARYLNREEYITHMAEKHGKKLKNFPCNKCESSFTTTSSMRRHMRDKHKGANRGLRCQFCTESKKTFSSRALLDRHIQLRHKDIVSLDTMVGGGDEADSSSEQDSNAGVRRRRRGAARMEEESPDGVGRTKKFRSSFSSSSSSSSAPHPLPTSGFRCAPCGFSTDDHASFLEHIGQHRQAGKEGGGVQCLECGACFTNASSLSRHRFITHKKRDANADGQLPAPSPGGSHDDKGSAPASPASQPAAQGKEEDGSLCCKVCGKYFEKAADLNTHFRTHGMAFINARNATKTT